MNRIFSEEDLAFRSSVAKFVDQEVAPVADEIDRRGEYPVDLFRRCGELGYFGLRYPEDLGGSGAGLVSFCILAEELARGSLSLAAAVAMQCLMGTNFVHRYGKPRHVEDLLRPALQGRKIGAFALTEPNAGSDLGAMATTAVPDGDEWVLNGQKTWITSATRADFFTVAATFDKEKKIEGVGFFLVEKGTPGLIVGKKIEKMAVRPSETSELALQDCRAPAENLLVPQGEGIKALMAILAQIRTMTGALGVGCIRAALTEGNRYAQERQAFGRPIGKFQAILHYLAEIRTELEASRLLVYDTAARIDAGENAATEAAIAKYFATEAACRAADRVARIFASYGLAEEYPIQRIFRDVRFLLFGGGTSEILRNIIGEATLR